MAAFFHVFQLSPSSLKLSEWLDIDYPLELALNSSLTGAKKFPCLIFQNHCLGFLVLNLMLSLVSVFLKQMNNSEH